MAAAVRGAATSMPASWYQCSNGFYAASAFVSFFFVRALINETRGRELEGMPG
jgi:hypothetical protein